MRTKQKNRALFAVPAALVAIALGFGCSDKKAEDEDSDSSESGAPGAGGGGVAAPTTGGVTIKVAAPGTSTAPALELAATDYALTSLKTTVKQIDLSVTGEAGTWVTVYNAELAELDLIGGTGQVDLTGIAPGTYSYAFIHFSAMDFTRSGDDCVEGHADGSSGIMTTQDLMKDTYGQDATIGSSMPTTGASTLREGEVSDERFWLLNEPIVVTAGSTATLDLSLSTLFDTTGGSCMQAPRAPLFVMGLESTYADGLAKLDGGGKDLNMVGTWTTGCHINKDDLYEMQTSVFGPDGASAVHFALYEDAACTTAMIKLDVIASFQLGAASADVDGATNVDVTFDQIFITADSQMIIDNMLEPSSSCDLASWTLGAKVDCTGKSFGDKDTMQAKGEVQYNVAKITDGLLFLSDIDMTHDGKTPAKRTVSFEDVSGMSLVEE